MTCNHCQGLETLFGEKAAKRELRSYQRKGPTKSTQALLSELRSEGVQGTSLLDIGGGIGAIQHELIELGASGVTNVDASTAYLKIVQQEAVRLGYGNLATYHHGDFVELASEIEDADIVTLDKVICCYPDMARLVGLSSARARAFYCLVYPRQTWYFKLFLPVANAYFRLRKNPFRGFLHRSDDVDAIVVSNGLSHSFTARSGIWLVAIYRRILNASRVSSPTRS